MSETQEEEVWKPSTPRSVPEVFYGIVTKRDLEEQAETKGNRERRHSLVSDFSFKVESFTMQRGHTSHESLVSLAANLSDDLGMDIAMISSDSEEEDYRPENEVGSMGLQRGGPDQGQNMLWQIGRVPSSLSDEHLRGAGLALIQTAEGQRVLKAGTEDSISVSEGEEHLGQGVGGWKHWGPYLSERAWGTVREDYSDDGNAWAFFPHDHARSRAYRWNEDGLAGISNSKQNICMSIGLWNEKDPIIKERLFGLTGPQGNHGEDVKEIYYYLDSTPTHSYMKMLYKYPQVEFPYEQLERQNAESGRDAPEVELIDVLKEEFEEGKYFDVFVEYAKKTPEDIICKVTAVNRSDSPAPLHIIPQVWYRNRWSWGYPGSRQPQWVAKGSNEAETDTHERSLGMRYCYFADDKGEDPEKLLFTENVTNRVRIYNSPNVHSFWTKDAINDTVVSGEVKTNPDQRGSKMGAQFSRIVEAGESFVVYIRLCDKPQKAPFDNVEKTVKKRILEANEFYNALQNRWLSPEEKSVQRQAWAGLLFSKQYYHYAVAAWLTGDPNGRVHSHARQEGRNSDWKRFHAGDIILMPDKWEYPWFAAWDLAFHVIPLAFLDPDLAKGQLILMLREWYMHPNGQLAAYEWNFSDVNPPVHAWACRRVYRIAAEVTGKNDYEFLEKVFHKLLLNFTWWVNRKDVRGHNVFEGGFLGLDNISVFDRSSLPQGASLMQADGTAWMGMYCLTMMAIALDLAKINRTYEDVATKFLEHFVFIAESLNSLGGSGLWDEDSGFFFDYMEEDGKREPIKVFSFVGLIPVFAVWVIQKSDLEALPRFRHRMNWLIRHHPELLVHLTTLASPNNDGNVLLSLVPKERLQKILCRVCNEDEFMSPFGLRSLSAIHRDEPASYRGSSIQYEPGYSSSPMFGGNSNWRGPIWLPVNYLFIESLRRYHFYYGDSLRVEMPAGSGKFMTLDELASCISFRLTKLFLRDSFKQGRPVYGDNQFFQKDPHARDFVMFYEFFNGDTGEGLGASHQTGWTALVAKLLQGSMTQNPEFRY